VCGDEWRAVSTRCLTDGWSRQSACPPFGRAPHSEPRQGRPEKDTESEPGKGGYRVRQEANTLFAYTEDRETAYQAGSQTQSTANGQGGTGTQDFTGGKMQRAGASATTTQVHGQARCRCIWERKVHHDSGASFECDVAEGKHSVRKLSVRRFEFRPEGFRPLTVLTEI
jgi:hypothetical protein